MTRCLLVDDDPDIRALVPDYLQGFGIAAVAVADGAAMRAALAAAPYELLLLDLMLPDADGLELCRWVRQAHAGLAVIMLTAQGDPLSRVLGLEVGADDYLAKPFEPRELVARIRAVLRRGGPAAPVRAAQLQFAGWHFDRIRRELVGADGTVVPLSAAEFRLLSAFVDHAGQLLGRDRLLALTRDDGRGVSDRAVDLAVSRLRAKLGDGPDGQPLIRTVRGEGYRFDAPVL